MASARSATGIHRWLRARLCACRSSCSVAEAAPLVFEKDIRPILKTHCFDCHGEGEKLKGGLDLRLRRLMIKGGDEGPVLVPGKPDKSVSIKWLHSGEMPQRDKKLTPQQVDADQTMDCQRRKNCTRGTGELGKGSGITEEERAFWSFQPVRKPAVPKTKPKDRVRTPIDAFLVRRWRNKNSRFRRMPERSRCCEELVLI